MFKYSKFNGNISNWNVFNVIDIRDMFTYSQFNGDLSNWNVFNMTYMCSMFHSAKIEDFKKRQKAVIEYQEILKNKQQLEKIITNNNSEHVIHKI